MELTIERGLPAPDERMRFDVLDIMRVGESVVVPVAKEKSLSGAFAHREKHHGKKFRRRTQSDGSIRVWRVA